MRPLLPHHVIIIAVRDLKRVGQLHGRHVPRNVADLGVPVIQVIPTLGRAVGSTGGDVHVVVGAGRHVVQGRGGDDDAFVLRVVEGASGDVVSPQLRDCRGRSLRKGAAKGGQGQRTGGARAYSFVSALRSLRALERCMWLLILMWIQASDG